jgi:hypothetical protein
MGNRKDPLASAGDTMGLVECPDYLMQMCVCGLMAGFGTARDCPSICCR